MQGATFNEFYDDLYYGSEIETEYCSKYYYMICCGYKQGNHEIIVEKYNKPFWKNMDISDMTCEIIFEVKTKDAKANIEKFLNAKIFEGKSFWEAEKDIKLIGNY